MVAVDSVAALTPRVELEGQMGEQTVGLQARLMSQALRKLAGNLNRAKTVCLFTNQIREKIGVMFGSPETQPGGRALKFYCSQRLDMRRIETLKEGTEAVGNRVRVKVVKNKVAAPVPPGGVRHRVRRTASPTRAACSTSRWSTTWSRSRARSSPTASCGSARGATTPSSIWPRTRSWPPRSRRSCSPSSGSSAPRGRRGSVAEAPEPDEAPKPPRPSPRPPRTPSPSARPRSRRRRWPGADAFERALEALAHRERTSAELGAWLAARGFEPAEVEAAIERLVEAGALDDERFAARFAEDKRELRGWGPERIRGALAARGLESATIDAALEGDEPAGQLERALELLERRSEARSTRPRAGRALAYLARRGYESELAYEAVRAHERLRGGLAERSRRPGPVARSPSRGYDRPAAGAA